MHLTWESFELSLGMSWFDNVRPTRQQPCMQFGRITVSGRFQTAETSLQDSEQSVCQQCPRFMSSTTALLRPLLQAPTARAQQHFHRWSRDGTGGVSSLEHLQLAPVQNHAKAAYGEEHAWSKTKVLNSRL
jgi:hypothetical protein